MPQVPPSPVSFHRNKNTEKLHELFHEEHKVFMVSSGYCWEEQGSLGGFTLWGWGRTLTHNGVVKGELKKFVQRTREIKLQLLQEATMWKDFCALTLLKMSLEVGGLELVSVSVTPLPAAGPLRNCTGPTALRTQKNHTQEPCAQQQPNSGNGTYFICADNAYPWLPKHSCFQAPLMAPLRVL